MEGNDEAYYDLAQAIICRAVQDYKDALKNNRAWEVFSIEEFFRSDYFRVLSNIDPEYIISKIRSDVNG